MKYLEEFLDQKSPSSNEKLNNIDLSTVKQDLAELEIKIECEEKKGILENKFQNLLDKLGRSNCTPDFITKKRVEIQQKFNYITEKFKNDDYETLNNDFETISNEISQNEQYQTSLEQTLRNQKIYDLTSLYKKLEKRVKFLSEKDQTYKVNIITNNDIEALLRSTLDIDKIHNDLIENEKGIRQEEDISN